MLSIDRRILEKISLDNQMTDIDGSKNKASTVTNKVSLLHTSHAEVTQTPQNEAHINDALRA